MSRVYTKMYNTNYEDIAKASAPLSVPANKMKSFAIPFPSEGFLERIIVWQATGSSVAFEIELLNSRIPYPPGEYDTSDPAADNLISYRVQVPVTAPLSALAGATMSFTDDDYGIGFRNVDGGWTLNERYLYLLIKPTGAGGVTTWNVTLQCRTEVG